jgi:hypothetical protein
MQLNQEDMSIFIKKKWRARGDFQTFRISHSNPRQSGVSSIPSLRARRSAWLSYEPASCVFFKLPLKRFLGTYE